METPLDLFCPACGAPLTPRLGCHSCCVKLAIHLQLRRFGTELDCRACGRRHVVRVTDIPGEQLWFGAIRTRDDARILNGLEPPGEAAGDQPPSPFGDQPP